MWVSLLDSYSETKRWTIPLTWMSILTCRISYWDPTIRIRTDSWALEDSSHIYTMWVTKRWTIPITLVHSNDWNILSGHFHVTTKRVVGFGDINAHIYDVHESDNPITSNETWSRVPPNIGASWIQKGSPTGPWCKRDLSRQNGSTPIMSRYQRSGYGLEPLVVVLISHEYHNQLTLFVTQHTNDLQTITNDNDNGPVTAIQRTTCVCFYDTNT